MLLTYRSGRSLRPAFHALAVSTVLLSGCLGGGGGSDSDNDSATSEVTITTLSSDPERVSGGDALIEIAAPSSVSLSQLVIKRNGSDVTGSFKVHEASGTFRGLVDGLLDGANSITVEGAGIAAKGSLSLTNYPITGPILSGPHLTPYECRTVESGLGTPLDTDCSAAQKIDYFYRTTAGAFAPFDPAAPRPSDLAQTTTYDGRTVPYIVRVEGGTVNRTIYRIAVLDDPDVSVDASEWKPGAGWNNKLAVFFGGSAGTEYNQGVFQAQEALSDLHLSRGFAYMISTELVNGRRGNAVLQGETLMMLKEYFIEHYGVPKWTVGTGGSGGAIQQLVITQMYPGLLDGLQPSVAFPDSHLHIYDCILFQNFYASSGSPGSWTPSKRLAAEGMTQGGPLGSTCGYWSYIYSPLVDPTRGCALNDQTLVYHPVTNPGGARCTTNDLRVNIVGKDPATGAARNTFSNVGLQYGLKALNAGDLTVDEFLDLNEGMGGFDIEGNIVDARTEGDAEAVRAAYESGLMASYSEALANVPILNYRPYLDQRVDIHDSHRDYTIRARLERSNGRSDNQVIWVSPLTQDLSTQALETMNAWLDNLAADSSPLSIDKVVKNKPTAAVDACWTADGEKIEEKLAIDGTGRCATLYPVHSEPRLVAGAPLTNDVIECQLKQIDFSEYDVTFNPTQSGRLASIFPNGVCDWSEPGVEQTPIKGTYQRY